MGGRSVSTALFGALLVVASVAGSARADDAGVDVVHLRDGGVVRGFVMETGPTQTRVKLADGEVRVIAGELIERVELAQHPASTGVPAATPAVPAAPAAHAAALPPVLAEDRPTESAARLHVVGPPEVEIEGRPGPDYDWESVCTGTCDADVRLAWEYRVHGSGIRKSEAFHLSSPGGQPLSLSVDAASEPKFTLGVVGMIIGGAVGYIGTVAWLVGNAGTVTTTTDSNGNTYNTVSPNPGLATAGGVMAIGGGLLFAVSGFATFANRASHVKVVNQPDQAALPRMPAPSWAARRPEVALPMPVVAPVWGGRF